MVSCSSVLPARSCSLIAGCLALALMPACTPEPPSAEPPSVEPFAVELILSDSPRSPLALVADVVVGVDATVHIEFEADGVATLRTPESDAGLIHRLDVLGLRAEMSYSLHAVATSPEGVEARSEMVSGQTGELPEGIPTIDVVSGTPSAGITLLAPGFAPECGLPYEGPYVFGIDGEGEVVWLFEDDWLEEAQQGGHPMELDPKGDLVLLSRGSIEVIDRAGQEVRSINHDDQWRAHHDVAPVPQRGFAVLSVEHRTLEVEELGGEVEVEGDLLVEVNSEGEVLWQWSMLDHLDPQRWPGPMSLGSFDGQLAQWSHSNSVFHDPDRDALVVSVRHQNWVISVDPSGGEVLWRLGADGDFALEQGEWFTSQHDARLSPDGVMTLFDNGNERPGEAESRAQAWQLDFDAMTASALWSWDVGFLSETHGTVEPLPDGGFLVSAGGWRDEEEPARVVELDAGGQPVWEVEILGGHRVSHAVRAPWVFPVDPNPE